MLVRDAITIQDVSMGMRVLLIILSRNVDGELIGLWADVALDQRFHKSLPFRAIELTWKRDDQFTANRSVAALVEIRSSPKHDRVTIAPGRQVAETGSYQVVTGGPLPPSPDVVRVRSGTTLLQTENLPIEDCHAGLSFAKELKRWGKGNGQDYPVRLDRLSMNSSTLHQSFHTLELRDKKLLHYPSIRARCHKASRPVC